MCSFVGSCMIYIHPSVRPSVRPSIHPPIHPSIHPSIHSFNHSIIFHSFIHSFIQSKYQKTNIIIFSANGENKNKTNFKYANESIDIVNKQTYLGIEMTSSGCYAYARGIFSKKATKIVFTIKRLLSNINFSAVETRNKLFDTLV